MNRNHKWILAIIPLISFLAIESSYAQSFYKWTDDKGATHYTQTPPPKKATPKTVQKILVNTHTPQDSTNAIKSLNDQSTKNLKTTADEEAATDKAKLNTAAENERRNKNSTVCQQIKTNQALLQTGQRTHTMDINGNRSYLTEEQKAAQINQQATQLNNDCPQ